MGVIGKGVVLAAAVAGLYGCSTTGAGSGVAATAAPAGQVVQCAGINSCKGQGSCAGAENACKAQNSCQGKGWVETTPESCEAKGGTVVASSM